MIGIAGNYLLRMKFGTTDVPIDPSAMQEFTIIQDMNRFLPYFRLRLTDTTGSLTHIIPFDKGMSRVSVEVGNSIMGKGITNMFDFLVYRRFPESGFSASNYYDAQGLLNVQNLFNPNYCRGFDQSIYSLLEYIGYEELKMDLCDISPSLNYTKRIVQPMWSNAQLFKYFKKTLGDAGGYAYMPFVYVRDGIGVLSFKSLAEHTLANPSYKFIVSDQPFEDYIPVTDYMIFDNYQALGMKGVMTQSYSYFDYDNSAFITDYDTPNDYISLSDFIMADISDSPNSQDIWDTGMTNEYTSTFMGKIRAQYYKRLNDLCKMWIHTWGLPNVCPGDVVTVLFAQGAGAANMFSYQYSGQWMVERVVQTFGYTYSTKLMLTRAGLNTDKDTSLLPASKVKL